MGLFKPIWKTENDDKLKKAQKAVERLKDEDKLFEIATTAPLVGVRICAARKIKDQQKLYQLARIWEAKYSDVQYAAIRGMTDESLLEKLMVAEELSSYQKEEVVRLIRNENALVRLVIEAKDFHSPSAAFNCLRSQSAFAQVALSAAPSRFREMAAHRLTDQAVLRQIARDDKNEEVRGAAVVMLDDPALLAEYAEVIAGYRYSFKRGCNAVSRITDAMALLIVASGTRYDEVRALCLERLNTPGLCSGERLDADRLAGIIRDAEDNRVRAAAARWLESLGDTAQGEAVAETIRRAKLVEAADQGRLDDLKADPETSFEALAEAFQKFIDDFTKHTVYVSYDDHFVSQEREDMAYYGRIAAGLKYLHDNTPLAQKVEARFPERQYTCDYEWTESPWGGGDDIQCESTMTITVWGEA